MKRLLLITIFLSSCVSSAPQKNVSYEVLSRDQRLGQIHLNIEVILEHVNQMPIKGVVVEVSSQSDKDQDKTDRYGIADISLSVYENESLDFRFHSKSKRIEWTKTVEKLPSGKNDLTFVFRKQPKGDIELIEVSY